MAVSIIAFHVKSETLDEADPVFERPEILLFAEIENPIDNKMGQPFPPRLEHDIFQQQNSSRRQNPVTVFEQLILLAMGKVVEHIADHDHVELLLPQIEGVLVPEMDIFPGPDRSLGRGDPSGLLIDPRDLTGRTAEGEIVGQQPAAATDIDYPGPVGDMTGDLKKGAEAPARSNVPAFPELQSPVKAI